MQIYEITQKKIQEGVLGGVAKNVGSAASAVGRGFEKATDYLGSKLAAPLMFGATALANKALDAANVPTGKLARGENPTSDPKYWGGADQAGTYGAGMDVARQKAAPKIRQIAQAEVAKWNRDLSYLMKQENVQDPTQLSASSKQNMMAALRNELHTSFARNKLGDNWKNLPNLVDRTARADAERIKTAITQAYRSIQQGVTTAQPDAATQLKQWENLLTAANDAALLVGYRPARRPAGPAPGDAAKQIINAVTQLTQSATALNQQVASKAPGQVTQQEIQQQKINQIRAKKLAKVLIDQGLVGMLPAKDMQQLELLAQEEDIIPQQSLSVGGVDKLNPNDPDDQRILAMLRQQGKI
jgi:hypothetical protein